MTPQRIAIVCLTLLLLSAPSPRAAAGTERETSYVYPPFKHTMGMSRVGSLELKLFLGPRAGFKNPQGLAVAKMRNRDDPRTDRDDDELTLLMVNSGEGRIFYNASLYSVKSYGERGGGEGRFLDPRGIAADRDGNVIVADTGNRRLVLLRLDDEMRWLGEITDADGPFCPTDVAVADGLIWATDYAGRLLRFDMTGAFLGEWPLAMEGELERPLALDVVSDRDEWNHLHRFSLVIVDREGSRVRAFNGERRQIGLRTADDVFGGPGVFGYPAVDLHGHVLLPDSLGGRIAKLSRNLETRTVIDHIDDDTPLRNPNSLTIHRRFGQLFVLENNGGSYAWTGTDIASAAIVDRRTTRGHNLLLAFTLTEPSFLTAVLVAPDGRETELISERRFKGGERRAWLRLDEAPPAGATLRLEATPTYSARRKLTVTRIVTDLTPAAATETETPERPASGGETTADDRTRDDAPPAVDDTAATGEANPDRRTTAAETDTADGTPPAVSDTDTASDDAVADTVAGEAPPRRDEGVWLDIPATDDDGAEPDSTERARREGATP